jgi:hypothetical protein
MALLETSLSASYQTSWRPRDALREIIANAIDAQERDGHGMDMTFKGDKLTVVSMGAKVPTSALLMGVSQSRAHDNAIGEFGEGLPMALLTLVRWGYPVTIVNDDEKWHPELHMSETYEENILAVRTRKLRKSHNMFKVEVSDVRRDEYDDVRSLFLRYHPAYNSGKTLLAHGRAKLLLQPEMKGKVYNKGVFVMERADMLFGYDLHTTLNRDRSIIDTYTLRDEVDGLLFHVIKHASEDDLKTLALAFMNSPTAFESESTYGHVASSDRIMDKIIDIWVEEHGTKLPVTDQADLNEAQNLGVEAVVTSPIVSAVLSRDPRFDVNTRTREAMYAVKKLHTWGSLNYYEQTNIRRAVTAMKDVRRVPGKVQIVDFAGETIVSHFNAGDSMYRISRSSLAGGRSAVLALARAICDAHGEGRSDSRVARLLATALGGE